MNSMQEPVNSSEYRSLDHTFVCFYKCLHVHSTRRGIYASADLLLVGFISNIQNNIDVHNRPYVSDAILLCM